MGASIRQGTFITPVPCRLYGEVLIKATGIRNFKNTIKRSYNL